MTGAVGTGSTTWAFNAEALLEKAANLGCDQAEVYESDVIRTPVIFDNNRLNSVETAETAVAAVRVIKGGRIGFATSSRAGDDTVVEMAVRAAEFGPEAAFDFAPAAPVRPDLLVYDPEVANWPLERMLEVGASLVDHVRSLADGIVGAATVEKYLASARLATSEGQAVSLTGTAQVVTATGELVEPENMIHFWGFGAGRRLDTDLPWLMERLETMFRRAARNVPFAGGQYPVIFAPSAFSDLIAPMLACVDGMAVAKGESPWRDKVGQKLFDAGFSLYDDPEWAWGLRTTPFDDEGTPTTRRAIIENGVLHDFLLNRRAAGALGRESTGNGYRQSPTALPTTRAANVIIPPGPVALADLVANVRDGLYVEHLMGAWAGNPFAGQVSGNVHVGFHIRDGEITGRVKDCMVSVGVFDAFRDRLGPMSREVELAGTGEFLPFVLLDGVSVSTKA